MWALTGAIGECPAKWAIQSAPLSALMDAASGIAGEVYGLWASLGLAWVLAGKCRGQWAAPTRGMRRHDGALAT